MPDNFPYPWSVADSGSAWIVKDKNGFSLGYFYYAESRAVGTGMDRMTREQAYAMAVNFARVPVFLGKQPKG